MITTRTVLLAALTALLGHSTLLVATGQVQQEQLVYTTPNDPVRLETTPKGKYIEVVNYSDREVKALLFACVTKDSDGKIKIEKPIKSIEYFDLENIKLHAADRKNSTFSFFSFRTSQPNIKQCRQLQALLAVVEVKFADESVWKITP